MCLSARISLIKADYQDEDKLIGTLTGQLGWAEDRARAGVSPRFLRASLVTGGALLAALADGALDAIPAQAIPKLRRALPDAIDADPALAGARDSLGVLDDALRAALVACVRFIAGVSCVGRRVDR